MGLPFRFSLIQPPAVSDLTAPPTYTDIYNETVGKQGDIPALFDPPMLDAGKLVDAFGADGSLTGPDPDLASAQEIYGQASPVQLDAHIAAYEATKPAGEAIISTVQGLTVPQIGPLDYVWVQPGHAPAVQPPSQPGAQVPGQITLGDPPFKWRRTGQIVGVGPGGIRNPRIATAIPVVTGVQLVSWSVGPPYTAPGGTGSAPSIEFAIDIDVDPIEVGQFVGIVVFDADRPQFGNKTALAYTVAVAPKR